MTAGGRELERAPGAFLSPDVGEVGRRRRAVAVRHERRLGLQVALATQVGDRLGEMPDRDRGNAGKRRLACGVGGAEETIRAEPPRALGNGENAADPPEPSVERELPDGGGALEGAAWELLRRREEREGDRQVEAGALLAQLRRGEIDRDAPRGEGQLGSRDPTAHSLPRLLAGAIREADDREARDAVANVRLYVDPTRLEADESVRDRACKHASRLGAEW